MNLKKIKILIVEDSMVAQKLLQGIILSDERFELVGIAENGIQAVEMVKKHKPDVVSMDIVMPLLDGVEATRKIMQENPLPIVIVSSYDQSTKIETAIKVLDAGAVTILPKPFGPGHPKYLQTARQYLNTLVSMSEIKVVRKKEKLSEINNKNLITNNIPETTKIPDKEFKILAIGASAGGPEGIRTILSGLPVNFPLPVIIVQHIDSHFAEGFAAWLNTTSKLPVCIPTDGDKIEAGKVYLPPGDHHIMVKENDKITITNDLPYKGIRPSVDLLFKSIAQVYGKNSIAVLLSGMGRDGAVELKNLFDLGAYTMAQDESSSLVFGMPGEAVKLGAVCKLLSPENITIEINKLTTI